MTPVVVRRIRADEGLQLREFRLRALADAPDAFGSTLVEASARPESSWLERAANAAASDDDALFVAEQDGRWCGLAGGFVDDEAPPDEVQLISMWVEPAQRGTGTAMRLVERVVAWAQDRGTPRVRLWVTEGNMPAIRLYERAGFKATEETAPVRPGSDLRERLMIRPPDGRVRPLDREPEPR